MALPLPDDPEPVELLVLDAWEATDGLRVDAATWKFWFLTSGIRSVAHQEVVVLLSHHLLQEAMP
jgi:hypothetical protein